jgi:transcriptional regulator with XRE-family HTH domain
MSLKEFIKSRGLTQKELAQALGISKASMSRRASGETEVTVRDLQRIWAVYGPLTEDEQRTLLY